MKNEYLQPYVNFFRSSEEEYLLMENLYNTQRDVNPFIQAQIHGITQIKKVYASKWDRLTLYDLFTMYTALHTVAMELSRNPEELNQWLKDLVKRMNREGILGKNMKLPINVNKLLYERTTRI